MNALWFSSIVWVGILGIGSAGGAPAESHLSQTATLHLAAPPSDVFPLFGPLGEKQWAGRHWSPHFLDPAEPKDVEGCVFTTGAGGETTWVLTAFDSRTLHIAYVEIDPRELVTQLDIALAPEGAGASSARVRYTWTSLSEKGLERLAHHRGPAFEHWMAEWESALNAYLKETRKK